MQLSSSQTAQYFQRSYTAVDGLWFVKTEESRGFDAALEIDRRVWEVLPKIQARMIKEWCDAQSGADGLVTCLRVRYELEGYQATVEKTDKGGVEVCIGQCPWLEKMKHSGREHLAHKVAQVICPTEHRAWAIEFGMAPDAAMPRSMCAGAQSCGFVFKPVG